jgi:O-antigen/teichoic acid export membrane protein
VSPATVAVPTAPAQTPAPVQKKVSAETKKHLRGSSILFAGRLLSLGINFATQVLIVRYLTVREFDAFGFGLSIVAMGQALSVLGLDKAVARFLPIYDEEGQREKVLGALVLALGSVLALGTAVVVLVAGFHGMLGGQITAGGTGMTVLLIMMLLSPLQALDDVLLATFAVFSNPKAIFVRKYVLAPMLRLAAIALVMAGSGDVRMLAVGYVLGGIIGVAAYAVMLTRTLRADGILRRTPLRSISLPVREIYSFAIPLLAVDMLAVVTNSSNMIMLAHWGDPGSVAHYRAVLPAAQLNTVMLASFGLLFTPLAARLFARKDREGIQELYWRTAVWIAVLSFPVFAATAAASGPLTPFVFGSSYADSAPILALLSLGYYFSAMLGFNGLTLRVFGMVRYSVIIAVAAGFFNVAINLLLIPRYGAIGAAAGTCTTFFVNNILKQIGLRRGTGIRVLDPAHMGVYGVIIAAALTLVAVTYGLHPGPAVSLGLVAIVSAVVFVLTRSSLRVGDMFPELLRVPLLRRVFG